MSDETHIVINQSQIFKYVIRLISSVGKDAGNVIIPDLKPTAVGCVVHTFYLSLYKHNPNKCKIFFLLRK